MQNPFQSPQTELAPLNVKRHWAIKYLIGGFWLSSLSLLIPPLFRTYFPSASFWWQPGIAVALVIAVSELYERGERQAAHSMRR